MTRYVRGYTGPMKPTAGPRPPKPVIDTSKPIIDPRKPGIDPPKFGSGALGFITDKLKNLPRFNFKKGGKTTTLHSITKSSKKSNW